MNANTSVVNRILTNKIGQQEEFIAGKTVLLITLILLVLYSIGAPRLVLAYEFFVSPQGSDRNAGSIEQPFATLEKARDTIRKLKSESSSRNKDGITVYLREGAYPLQSSFVLEKEDSGSPNVPIVYRSFKGEEVRLIGGIEIQPDRFSKVTSFDALSKLEKIARDKVKQIDLGELGIQNLSRFSWDKAKPKAVYPEPLAPEELFFNNKSMKLARWPNDGWARTGEIIDSGSAPRYGDNTRRGSIFRFVNSRISRWTGDDTWLRGYWKWDWYDEAIPLDRIDSMRYEIKLARPHYYGVEEGKRFYVFNTLRELDEPGEYFIDRKEKILYFWPPSKMEASRLALSLIDAPLVVLKDASNITIRDISIEIGRDAGIYMEGGEGNHIVDVTIRNVGNTATIISGGKSHKVTSSTLYNLGTRGMVVFGGGRENLTPGRHALLNNHIHHYGRRISTPHAAIEVSGVGNIVANNLIYDAPHMGIRVHGNDHVIERNEIHHVCEDTSDAGAIYMGRDWSERGNIIKHNFIHQIYGLDGKSDVTGIYLDDFSSGTSIQGNIITGIHRGLLIGGGRDNYVRNNIVMDSKIPLSIDARGVRWAKKSVMRNNILASRLEKMPYRTHLWRNRYPQLVNILNNEPGVPKGNLVQNNYFIHSGLIKIHELAKEYGVIENNYYEHIDRKIVKNAKNYLRKTGKYPALTIYARRLKIPIQEIGIHRTSSNYLVHENTPTLSK